MAYFTGRLHSKALDLIGHLRAAFKELIEDLDWMDDATRDVAVDKVSFNIALQ